MNTKRFVFGTLFATLLVGIFGSIGEFSSHNFSARILPSEQETSGDELFIPHDIIAEPGKIGEIVVKAGDHFPAFAQEDTIGLMIEVEWDTNKIDFLGGTLQNTIFDTSRDPFANNGDDTINEFDPYGNNGTDDFDITVTHDPVENTAKIMVWTGGTTGVHISAGDDLIRIPVKISPYAQLGDEIVVHILNSEVAYDINNTQSYALAKFQEGVIRIGNPNEPNVLHTPAGEMYFEKNILAKPGEERVLALRMSEAKTIAGFLMDVQYPENQMTFLGVETEGSALHGNGFKVLTNIDTENHIGVLGATGKRDGGAVKKDDPFLLFRFLIHEDVPLGTNIPLRIHKAQIADAETLEITTQEKTEGFLTVNSVSSLQVVDTLPLSSTSVRIVFSDDIIGGNMDEIRFTPDLLNENTTFETEGKSIIIRNLTTMLPDTTYRIDLPESISGSLTGSLNPEQNYAFFRGFPTQYPLSAFYVENIKATSATTALITFSRPVNPLSIEAQDFHIDGLTVTNAVGNENTVTLTTTAQSVLTGSSWLSIENTNRINDPLSKDGELLSNPTAPFIPYGYSPNGPQIKTVEAEKDDIVKITFDSALLGSSLSKDAFSITELGSTEERITAESFYELSADHTVVTFHKVHTLANKIYGVRILAGTLQSVDKNPIEAFGNIMSFFGQSSFFTPWDFGMNSAESVSSSEIQVVFSEDVDTTTATPDAFEIWTRDDGNNPRKLPITKIETEGNVVHIHTEAQKEGALYFILSKQQTIQSVYGEILGVPNGHGFTGFSPKKMRVVSVSPKQLNVGEGGKITLTGVHFPEGVQVRINGKNIDATRLSDTEIEAVIPSDISLDTLDIVAVSPNGDESTLAGELIIVDPAQEEKLKPIILSEESYATPYRVPNDGNTSTTLWVKIRDPRGVQDIEKVTADLRSVGGPAAAAFSLFHLNPTMSPEDKKQLLQEARWDEGGTIWKEGNDMAFIDGEAWYFLSIKVPSTIPTSLDPTFIPVTVENKTGRSNTGTVEVLVNRDLESSIPPVITSASAMPALLVPGDERKVIFQTEIEDADGGENVARVVLDATQVGLGILVLQPLDEIKELEECKRTDYVEVIPWTECIGGKRTRVVELKPGVECKEVEESKPQEVMECVGGLCRDIDWEETGTWGGCKGGTQYMQYRLKNNTTCNTNGATGPSHPEERACVIKQTKNMTRSIFDWIFPKANAAVFGNRTWFKSKPQNIPSWVSEGNYELPLTVLDREGTEVKGTISIQIARDASGTPAIDKDDIYVSPRHSVSNDAKTPFRVFAKVIDPNGYQDIESVSVNLSEIGLYPVAMKKGQIEGAGAWYYTDELTVPRSVLPGYRTLEVSATDKSGNSTKTGFTFYVATPETSGNAPEIFADKTYSNPRAFLNDQKTRGTLYVYVEEGDAPLAHVSANLGTILEYTGEKTEKDVQKDTQKDEPILKNGDTKAIQDPFAANILLQKTYAANEEVGKNDTTAPEKTIPTAVEATKEKDYGDKVAECVSTDSFGCMTHAVSEGSRGHWYYLPNLIVRENVPASQNPYYISVVATDTDGRKTDAEIPVYVSDGVLPLVSADLPHLVSAVATERNEVQAYFSASVDPSRITKDVFTLTLYNDVNTRIPVKSVDIRSDGRVVTITTNSMNPGEQYTLFADSEKLGLRQVQQTDNQADFVVHSQSDRNANFEITHTESLSPNALKITFNKEILLNSFESDGSNFTITRKGSGEDLEVYGAQIKDEKTVLLSTDFQIPGAEYILRTNDILDYTGKKLRLGTDIHVFSSDADYGNNPFVLSKHVSKEITTVGETVDFTISVSNEHSENTMKNVTLVDVFSHDMLQTITIDTGDAFSCGNTNEKIACHIDEIPPGVTYEIHTRFKTVSSGIATNSIMAVYDVEKDVVDALLTDDITPDDFLNKYDIEKSILSSANIIIVDPGNPFLIRKTPDKVEAGVNEEVNFTVDIQNRTPAEHFTNVHVVDTFPEALLKIVEVHPVGDISCSNTASTVDCFIPLFEPGKTYRFIAKYIALAEGMVTNTVVAEANSPQNFSNTGDAETPVEKSTGAGSANVYIQNPFLNSDFNGDTRVDFLDFSIFASQYGKTSSMGQETDLNRDGRVDFLDFSIFAQQYGTDKTNAPIRIPEHTATPEQTTQKQQEEGQNNAEQGGDTNDASTTPGQPKNPPLP